MTDADLIELDEGRRLVPYLDSLGILTWGVGRNIRDVPFSLDETDLLEQLVDRMFENDRRACRADLLSFPWFGELNEPRQAACMSLRFNLGPAKFRGFTKFLAAMRLGDYARAGAELVDSHWYSQVAERGPRTVKLIQLGVWP